MEALVGSTIYVVHLFRFQISQLQYLANTESVCKNTTFRHLTLFQEIMRSVEFRTKAGTFYDIKFNIHFTHL